jgi:hypothetical protein
VSGADLNKATALDSEWLRTDLATLDGAYNFQVLRFHLTDDQLGATRELTLEWTGHGELTVGYPTFASIYNDASSTWEPFYGPKDTPSDATASYTVSLSGSDFCLRCHSGTAPSGVVVPAGVTNIGAGWTGATGGDWHSGVASTGFGGTLKPPYARGQAVECSACHASHGSSNLYHVPGTVNGASGIVVSNSNSAKNLCAACHAGNAEDWHSPCTGCHYPGYYEGNPSYFNHGPYQWSGADCLACHGHSRTWAHAADDPDYFNANACHCGVPGPYRTF